MNSESFFDFITPARLYFGALIFAAITTLFVILIYINLYLKKRRFFSRQEITDRLNIWIGEALINEEDFGHNTATWLDQYLKSPINRQYITDCLINLRKNISGAAAEKLINIYEELGLNKDSLKKLNSLTEHKKCRGIYELYMMRQESAMPDIEKYTNSPVSAVRMEAQTAIVGFYGFKGLSFLASQTYPLNDWQQLKLLEQLHTFHPEDMPDLALWLRSANNYVTRFALKLADIYQRFEVHNIVVMCLSSKEERVRCQAITTLGRIANENTAAILIEKYADETMLNKKNVLRQLAVIGNESNLPFLAGRLDETDDTIKLEAGKAMAMCCSNGWNIFQQNIGNSDTLLSISKQIRYELAL